MMAALRCYQALYDIAALTKRRIGFSADRLVTEDYPIHAVTVPSRHAILKIDAFLDFLRSLYQPVPYWDALDTPQTAAALRAAL